MEASLDTNVIIHLYKANLQSVLFNRFQKLKVYEFIRHHEMNNHADSEVIPFAFFEIILIDYLERRMSEKELINTFNSVCALSGLTWSIDSKLKGFMRRFWSNPYSESEKAWMNSFCKDKGINAKERIQELWNYIKSNYQNKS